MTYMGDWEIQSISRRNPDNLEEWHSRLQVVPLSLCPSCVTQKKTARKKWPREILGVRRTAKQNPGDKKNGRTRSWWQEEWPHEILGARRTQKAFKIQKNGVFLFEISFLF